MSVRQAQREIDSAEFSEWIAYHNIKPFTLETTDNILAIIASILANVYKKPGKKPFKYTDFLPKTETKRKIETGREMEIKLKAAYPPK